MAEQKLKQQLQDITDLYNKEKDKNVTLQNSINDLRRREPLVQMLWQEVVLLRRLIEKQLVGGGFIANLPTGRLSATSKASSMTPQDKLAVAALTLINSNMANGDLSFLIPQNVAHRESELNAKDIPNWLTLQNGPAAGGNDAISSAQADAEARIKNLQLIDNATPATPTANIPAAPAGDIPPAPAMGAVPPAPALDGVPPAPALGGIPAAPVLGNIPPAPFMGSGAPPAPFLGSGAPPAPFLGSGAPPAPFLGSGAPPAPFLGSGAPPAPNLGGAPPAPMLGGAPPAPMMGGPPAPMLGGAPMAPKVDMGPQPSKPMIKPGKKMKALHWKAIIVGDKNSRSDVAKSSVWAGLESLHDKIAKSLDINDLEEKFSNAPAKKPLPTSPAPAAKSEEADDGKPKRVLDPKRHNQLSIMLSKMPKLEEMKQAILTLDSTKLTPDQVDGLHKNLFTSEEVELVKECGIPPEKLQLPEQWILALSKVPQLAARLECWRFSQIFDDLYNDVNKPLSKIDAASKTVAKSENFKKTLAVVLAVGNYLNGGTPRGQADGFQMESLGKLIRLKDNDGKSMVEYVVALLTKQFGEDFVSKLNEEFSMLNEVKVQSLKTISSEGRKLMGKTNLVLKMRSLVTSQPDSEAFEKKLGPLLDKAGEKVKELEERCKTVFADFVKLMLYLEPDLNQGKAEQINTEEFFSMLDEFITYVFRAYDDEKKKKAAEAEAAKKAQHMVELKKAMAKGPGAAAAAAAAAAAK